MIDVCKDNTVPYVFYDNGKAVITKNPSEGIYRRFISLDNNCPPAVAIDAISESFKSMLYPDDSHYIEELDYSTKMALVVEYFQYHSQQLERSFRGSIPTGF